MLQGLWGDMKMSGWVEVGFWRPPPCILQLEGGAGGGKSGEVKCKGTPRRG